MKPAGTIEADLGTVSLSTGVQMRVSVTWNAGRTYLELREEPRGEETPKRQYRHFHIRSDRLPDLIRRMTEADNLIASRGVRHRRGGSRDRSSTAPKGPAVVSKACAVTAFSHMRAREAAQ